MFLTVPEFEADYIRHGFFTRHGGVSTGLYQSLNCGYGSGDNPDDITENRRRVAAAFGHENVLTVHQIHSAECVTVREPWQRGGEPKLDALATDRPGVMLGILTADCGPVLFHGVKQDGSPVIGAAHAGWGGALGGVLENTVQAMHALGTEPETVRAALGPCIGPASYEVSEGFEVPFLNRDPEARRFFAAARPGHLMFDLPGYIRFRLNNTGVRAVSILARDTCAEEGQFFSYRRSVQRGEGDYGRQISTVMIV